jgi:hypothetical protein
MTKPIPRTRWAQRLGVVPYLAVRKTCVIPELTGKEFASVIRLPAPRPYEYFVKKVADRDTMWGLCDGDGWMTSTDDSQQRGRPS